MNSYGYIRRSNLFKEWDGIEQPDRALIQLAYDFAYHNCEASKPDREHRDSITEMLYLLKNGEI